MSIPFNCSNHDPSPQPASLPTDAAWWEVPWSGPRTVYQEWGWTPQWDWDQGQGQWELQVIPPPSPSPSPHCGFESDWSSASTSSSMSLRSERSEGSRCPHHGWWPHRKSRGHMKIDLPVFKDEDTKDAVTYQSWHWDLTMYYIGCQDCTLLPYAISSLQGYPGKLVRSSGMDITQDDVLTILDEHYNNVKALDALNQ